MGLFNIDSGFARFMNRAIDVLELNILWVIFSLPIFTIGASTSAAFYVTLKMVDEEEGYIAKSFVKAFKDNFKQGTIMWCITAPCIYFSYLIWQAVIKGDDIHFLIIIGAILFTAVAISINLYAYPMIARYDNSLKNIIRNSFGICLMYFGRSVFIIVVVAIECVLIFWNKWTCLAGLLIGPEFVIYTISGIAKRIFQKIEKDGGVIIPQITDSDAETDEDSDAKIDEESDI
ncbi:MAG: DUF624 domain-containing protein [Treponema sp.]|nr:DUF624 domain-containing protein [Treponema sp.]